MLTAKIFVNEKQIDEIRIFNVGEAFKQGFYEYEIEKPEGIKATITHQRSAGYKSLLIMVLNEIIMAEKKK
jgi:hypothetical protein